MIAAISEVGRALPKWTPFFALAGAAAATLVGLIFVAVSLNVRVMDKADAAHIRRLASRTLSAFMFILLVSLVCLIPDISPLSLGLSVGIPATAYVLRIIVSAVRTRGAAMDRRTALGLAAYVGAVLMAYQLGRDQAEALNLVPIIVITLLAGAAWNAWDLLLLMGGASPGRR
jgi:hypothetical protein